MNKYDDVDDDTDSDSSGDQRAVGSRFQVMGPYKAKLRWPVDV